MTELTREDLELARWCAFTITKGFQADRDGTLAAGKLVEKLDAALRSRPAVADAEVMALVERLDAFWNAYVEADRAWAPGTDGEERERRLATFHIELEAHWEQLSAALRSGRTRP